MLCIGCAGHLEFGRATGGAIPSDAVSFYDQVPAVVVTISGDCTVASTLTSLAQPGGRRWVKPVAGYGSSQLSANFAGSAAITSFGQTSDNKVPETITAVSGLIGNVTKFAHAVHGEPPAPTKPVCIPELKIYTLQGDSWREETTLHATGKPLR
jgi:hypothetical protein